MSESSPVPLPLPVPVQRPRSAAISVAVAAVVAAASAGPGPEPVLRRPVFPCIAGAVGAAGSVAVAGARSGASICLRFPVTRGGHGDAATAGSGAVASSGDRTGLSRKCKSSKRRYESFGLGDRASARTIILLIVVSEYPPRLTSRPRSLAVARTRSHNAFRFTGALGSDKISITISSISFCFEGRPIVFGGVWDGVCLTPRSGRPTSTSSKR